MTGRAGTRAPTQAAWPRKKGGNAMREKGSYTVEAAIVMSAIIMIVFAIISAFLLLYQNVVITYVAQQAAQQGAALWTDMSVQMDGTRQGQDKQNVYYRLGELGGGGSKTEEKKQRVKTWAEERLKELIPQSLVGSGAEQVNVSFENTIFQRFVTVEIRKAVDIPIAGIAQYFGDDLDVSVKARAAVSEPAEYIRTLDLGILVAQDLWAQIKDKLGPISSWFQ